ncbi:indolepyruvate ferredoxin oxidoreductase subunit alpha [Herbaspirillum autotrophicum]|uniref:indolepyruvate ferredoxin oxidoreductase subunit alpha n=1 Tax=Herbaspirillum autotrophicum TaxID=180195 RepID=UPI00067B156F|nr:4Fe-4S binding protein [Herbaspirillum autotrophicum]
MAFVIGSPCIDIKDGACAACCPVDCIYQGGRMFYINPEECISCGICVSVCPVDAIEDELDMVAGKDVFIAVNRDFFGPQVSNLRTPGGAESIGALNCDHPHVSAYPGAG